MGSSIILPEEYPSAMGAGTIILGQKSGTKIGRPQYTLVRDPLVLRILRWLKLNSEPSAYVCRHTSLSHYAKILKRAANALGLGHLNWTPHSPRAGRASDLVIADVAFVTIRELGRWACDHSPRRYLDIMAVMGAETATALRPFLGVVADIEANFDNYFRWEA